MRGIEGGGQDFGGLGLGACLLERGSQVDLAHEGVKGDGVYVGSLM